MRQKLYWILPVTLKKKIYLTVLVSIKKTITTENNLLGLELNDQMNLYDNYIINSQSNDKNKYQYLYQQLTIFHLIL